MGESRNEMSSFFASSERQPVLITDQRESKLNLVAPVVVFLYFVADAGN